MKKFISMAILAAMILTMAGCSDNKENSSVPSESSSTSDVSKPESKPEESKPESKPEESKPEDKPAEPEKTVSPADIEAAIAKALGDGYLCTVDVPDDELYTSPISWLDLEQVESYVAKRCASFGRDSVAIAKCKAGYADDAVKVFNEYYAQTISYIRQYPFDVAKVEGARIYKVGDIVMFILAGNIADSDATAEDEAKLAARNTRKSTM